MDQNLISKKKKLLLLGDNSKYCLDSEGVEKVAKHPDMLFDLMLPDETIEVQEVRDLLNHVTNNVEK